MNRKRYKNRYTIRNQEETKLWHEFPEELVQKMSEIPFALHAHTYTVTLDTFREKKGIHKEMVITQIG